VLKAPRLKVRSAGSRVGTAVGVAAVVVALLALARAHDLVEGIELRLVDLRTRHFAGGRGPDPRIVLAEVTEADVAWVRESLSAPWPWDLAINAHVFGLVAAAGAKAVVVDVLHFDRGAGLDDMLNPEEASEAERDRCAVEAESATLYGEALAKVGSAVVAFELSGAPIYEIPARVAASRPRLGRVAGSAPPGLARPGANLPVRRVAEGATVLAFANFEPDRDGIARRATVVGRWGDRVVQSLPLAAAALLAGADPAFEGRGVRVGNATQRLMGDGSFLVSFRGRDHGVYPEVRPSDLIRWAVLVDQGEPVPAEAKAALEGKVLVWGVNLSGAKDVLATPISATLHGADFHAHAIDDLLHGDGRVRAGRGANLLALALVALAAALGTSLLRGRASPHLAAALVAGLYVAFDLASFGAGTSRDLFSPLLAVLLAWSGTTVARLLTEGRRNRWLEGTFGRYLAPSIIEALKKDPSMLVLGGQRREITILFSDVAGFTNISEALEPEQVVRLLNAYLTAHAAEVMREGGVVDKFEGDAVMAFFGDPVPMSDHAVRACRTALRVTERLPELEPLWRSMGLTSFGIRIGLNSGTAVVGNMGSDQRFDYTCMGDSVNLASRLEGANKAFGSTILLGPLTWEQARDEIVVRPLAAVRVVGRSEPAPVCELLAMREGARPQLVALAQAFSRSQAAARAGDLAGARAALAEAEAIRPGDPPSAWWRERLDRMEEGFEPVPWPGVVELRGK
jgi:adenylate cyclase